MAQCSAQRFLGALLREPRVDPVHGEQEERERENRPVIERWRQSATMSGSRADAEDALQADLEPLGSREITLGIDVAASRTRVERHARWKSRLMRRAARQEADRLIVTGQAQMPVVDD